MSGKKKSGNEKKASKVIILVTAILNLIDAAARIIGHLIE